MSAKVYSFDVFDTVLTRNVSKPKEIFRLVQLYLPAALPDVNSNLHNKFYGVRVWSEHCARRRSAREDVSLGEIYDVISECYDLDEDKRMILMNLEMAIESRALIAINGAPELVARRRSQGAVVYISDMYLPQDFIVSILERYGLFMPEDRVYVSGDYGLTKGSGKLYAKVLEDFAIDPKELVHLGDNPFSDFSVPLQMGINFDDSFGRPLASRSRLNRWRQHGQYLRELLYARWLLN